MGTAKVYVSSSAQGNQSPIADPGGPYNGEVGKLINFDGSKSKDPDYGDSITSYDWDFGDGSTSSEKNPSHYYSSAGNFTISLTVTDETGKTNTASIYALIKTKSTDESPGFEFILTILVIVGLMFIIKKKKKL